MSALLEQNPEFRAVRVFRVDFAEHQRDAIVTDYDVRSRATLLVLRGGIEAGRLSWSADEIAIRALLELAIE